MSTHKTKTFQTTTQTEIVKFGKAVGEGKNRTAQSRKQSFQNKLKKTNNLRKEDKLDN